MSVAASASVSPLSWPQRSVIALIAFYQKHLSPRKGFVCAHRKRHGGDSCSQYARRLVETQGVIAAWKAMPRRFAECRQAVSALELEASAIMSASTMAMSDLQGDVDLAKNPEAETPSDAESEEDKAKRSSRGCGGCDPLPVAACDLGMAGADCSALECGGCEGAGACA